jgi:arylsulfatase A-like enzyme
MHRFTAPFLTSFGPAKRSLFGLGVLALATLAACTPSGDATSSSPPRSPIHTEGAAPTTTSAAQAPAPPASASASASSDEGAVKTPAAASNVPSNLNVLMISIDSMRTDMPWNGYPRDIAPVLTAFEKTAVSYTRSYAISSYTAMSLGGFLAARYPSEVERSGYFFSNYPDSVTMFPELLQKAGVRTASAQAHFYFDQKSGFRQGFDVYEIVAGLKASNTTDANITSPQHLELALKILGDKANTSGRFFTWFHFLDPHDQYMTHPDVKPWGTSSRDKYDGEITFVDQHVGKLLDFVAAQDWGKRTVVIVTADHGEAFGEHKLYRHGFEIYDVLTHVPLMIRAPGAAPRRIDAPRSAIDLPPTIFELVGAPVDPSFQGKSLVPELYGKEAEAREVIVDLPRTSDNDRRRALIRGDYKLIAFGDDDNYALYDVIHDPGETKDLTRDKSRSEVFEQMKAAYKAKSATIHDVCPKMTEKLRGKKKGKKC